MKEMKGGVVLLTTVFIAHASRYITLHKKISATVYKI